MEGYIIAVLVGDGLKLYGTCAPTIYDTQEEVEAEMENLAMMIPEATFVWLKIGRTVSISDLVWK